MLTITFVLIVVLGLWAITSFNGLVRLTNNAKEAWSDIDVQLKRRYDLIPNLVATVKGYASHESTTLEKVVALRNTAMQAGSLKEHAEAENQLSGALKSIFALAENYPDLKANQNFLELQRELSDTENKIQAARRFYNTNVRDLNTTVESFPGAIFASLFRFTTREFFELDDTEAAAKQPVSVQF